MSENKEKVATINNQAEDNDGWIDAGEYPETGGRCHYRPKCKGKSAEDRTSEGKKAGAI